MSFVPCSRHHKSCSKYHADLVRGYQEERERQETANEMILTNESEKQIWKENGNFLINFKTWLIGHRQAT